MNYAIVVSSRTGNTKSLADAAAEILKDKGTCLYQGAHNPSALSAEVLLVGFWTDKGTCDGETADFLTHLQAKKLFLFGTAGFGGSQVYFDKIIERTRSNLSASNQVLGTYMCQGKMPFSVRARFEKLLLEYPADEKCPYYIDDIFYFVFLKREMPCNLTIRSHGISLLRYINSIHARNPTDKILLSQPVIKLLILSCRTVP